MSSGYAPGISSSGETIAAGKSILLDSDSNVSWSSSNTNIATVKNGVVNTKAAGWVTISAYTSYGASTCLLHVTPPDNIRFTFASPNSAPKGATVTFKAITDRSRTAVRFVVTNGSTSYTVDATSKTADGSKNYIWSGSRALSLPGIWTVKAYAKTASSDYATTPEGGEGEVFITNATDTTTTVLGERRASDGVIKMIAEFEGFLPTITGDYITGDPTIGHGKVIWDNEQFYNDLTENEAYAYLCQTVNSGPYTSVTNNFLTSNNAKFNQNQFDALVCFAYNLGKRAARQHCGRHRQGGRRRLYQHLRGQPARGRGNLLFRRQDYGVQHALHLHRRQISRRRVVSDQAHRRHDGLCLCKLRVSRRRGKRPQKHR